MDKRKWKSLIISALRDMADEQLQRRAWAGVGPEVSSLVEVICSLFDDALLLEYVRTYERTLATEILSDVRSLDERVKNLDTEYLDTQPAHKVIDSPQWAEIRCIAMRLKLAFEQAQN